MKKIILLVSSDAKISCHAELPTFLNSQNLRKIRVHFKMWHHQKAKKKAAQNKYTASSKQIY